MVEEDLLDVYHLNYQTESMISQLNENIQKLKLCSEKLSAFLETKECSGESFSAASQQISDYKTIVNALIIADEYQKSECYRLVSQIGTDKLDGSIIIPKMKTHERKADEAMEDFAKCIAMVACASDEFTRKFYEIEALIATSNIIFHEKMYQKEKAKADQFDEISQKTSSLFSNVSNIRVAIQKGLSDIATSFDGTNYKTKASSNWKENLRSVMKANSNSSMVELSRSMVKVKGKNGRLWYGGNQNLLYNPNEDTSMNEAYMAAAGCQLVALIDMKLYMEGKDEVDRETFSSVANDYLKSRFTIRTYYTQTHAGVRTNSGKNKIFDDDLQMYVSRMARSHGYLEGASWGETREIKIDDIKKQIAHDIPVMYHVGTDPDRPDLKLNLYTKDADGQFSRVYNIETDIEEEEVFNEFAEKNSVEFADAEEDSAGLHNHFVVITGAEETINVDDMTSDTMLKISSWGREYYFSYNEAVAYKEEILSGMTKMTSSEYCISGLDNFSIIKY